MWFNAIQPHSSTSGPLRPKRSMVDGNWRFRVYGLPPPAVPARCYPDNLRWATPYVIGENPPPGRTQSPGSPQRRKMHLPAPPSNLRSPARRPRHPGLRGAHCDDAGRIIYKQEEPCSQEPHRTYPYYRLPYGPPPSVSHQNYSRFTGGVYETPQVRQGNPTRVNKGTSRKRASIACQACRSRKVGRKIRCGGYGSDPGGKCWSCARLNRECSFLPLSWSTSLAPGTPTCRQTERSPPSTCQLPNTHTPAKHCVSVRFRKEPPRSHDDSRTEDTSQTTEQQRLTTLREQGGKHKPPLPQGALQDLPERRPAGQNTSSGASTLEREGMVQPSRDRLIMSVKNLVG